jgi:hypothetical protein
MNWRESKGLHLDVPHPWRQIERVSPSLIRERRDLLVALRGSHGGSGQKLIRRPHRAALPHSGGQKAHADNAGNEVEIGSHDLLEAVKTALT